MTSSEQGPRDGVRAPGRRGRACALSRSPAPTHWAKAMGIHSQEATVQKPPNLLAPGPGCPSPRTIRNALLLWKPSSPGTL